MKYLRLEQVLTIHERVIALKGGDPAVLDLGRVESAVALPRQSFGGVPFYKTLAEKAAALGYALNMNHGFADGNKRTALMATEMFLIRNGHEIDATADEKEAAYLNVAAGVMDQDEFGAWLRGRMVRRRVRG